MFSVEKLAYLEHFQGKKLNVRDC